MIIGTVTGAFGARFFTDTVGLGTVWGPILGLLFGALCGAIFASLHAVATITFRVDHIVSGRGDQPGRDRSGALPVLRVLQRAVDAVGPGRPAPGAAGHPRVVVAYREVSIGRSRTYRRWSIVAALMVIPVWYSLYRHPVGA